MAIEALELGYCPVGGVSSCGHCGLPVPSGEVEPGAEVQFCCAGCRSVYAIVREYGLTDYYRYRDAAQANAVPAVRAGSTYAEYDDPAFSKLHTRDLPDGLRAAELVLEGVHCAACLWLVEKLPRVLAGVEEARLDMARSVVRVVWDPARVSFSKVAARLASMGYPPHPRHGLDRQDLLRRENRVLLARMGVAGAAAGNAMLLAIALYSGAFDRMEAQHVALFRWMSLVVSVPAVLWCGSVFFRGAWSAIRTRTPHMDLPISLGIAVGMASSVASTVLSRGDVYFDSITTLVFLLLVGRWLQRRQQQLADSTSDLIQSLAPHHARLIEDGRVREVPASTVAVGSLVEVRAGERVPVDGTVVEGQSSVDVSLLTGESAPEAARPGTAVFAGLTNLRSRLVVRAEQTGSITRLSKIIERVEEAARTRAPVVLLADRISGYFVTTVLSVAAVTLIGWWLVSPARAVDNAVALLIVTCPCALGLATPLALSAALGRAARQGILVKGGSAVQSLAAPGLIVFDKTGTLTEGRLRVTAISGDAAVVPLVAAAEQASCHPIARALAQEAGPDARHEVAEFDETPGGGITAVVDGRRVRAGSERFVAAEAEIPAWAADAAGRAAADANTPIVVAVDGTVRAVLALSDPLRPDARSSLLRLKELGYRLAIVSGDRTEVVSNVVARLGVELDEALGQFSPEQKLDYVRRAAAAGPIFMVGDGVNDAAALTAATVGIAVHGGAEASLAAADVFTTKSGLGPVLELFEGSRRTFRVIRRSLIVSLLYNSATAALAVSGLLGPLLAAVLMPVSSLSVVTSSYRSRTFDGGRS